MYAQSLNTLKDFIIEQEHSESKNINHGDTGAIGDRILSHKPARDMATPEKNRFSISDLKGVTFEKIEDDKFGSECKQ